jgi:hypothetical protein
MGRETDPSYGIQLDGVIGRRDVVLMSIPDEACAAYMDRKQQNAAVQSADNAVAEFLARGESMGVSVADDSGE